MALEPGGERGREVASHEPLGTAGTLTVATGVVARLMLIALVLGSCTGGVPQERPPDHRLREVWGIFLGCVREAQDGPLSAERLAMLTDVQRQTAEASTQAIERANTDPGFASAIPVLTEGIMRELFLAEVATGALDSYSKQAAALLMVKEELEALGLVDSIPGRCPDHLITEGQ